MITLVPGANGPLPNGPVSIRVPGPFDVSALITGNGGKVSGDGDFVFYNQPAAPGARLSADTVTIDPARLRSGAERVVVVVSAADPAARLAALPPPAMDVRGADGTILARFVAPKVTTETVLLLAEVYRRGGGWKVRAIGQGYAAGLAGLARDFGVDVEDDGAASSPPGLTAPPAPARPAPTPRAPAPRGPAPRAPAQPSGSAGWPAPRGPAAWPAPPPSPEAANPELDEVLRLTNAERARVGSPPLVMEPRLALAAQRHSEDMAAQDYLAHVSKDGRQLPDRTGAVGYVHQRLAENVAAGQQSAAEVVTGWMNSPGHRENLLNRHYTQIGIGRAYGGSFGIYWTQVFGTPR